MRRSDDSLSRGVRRIFVGVWVDDIEKVFSRNDYESFEAGEYVYQLRNIVQEKILMIVIVSIHINMMTKDAHFEMGGFSEIEEKILVILRTINIVPLLQ